MYQAPTPAEAKVAAAFKVFDADNSGTLSAAELQKILTRPGTGTALSIEDAQQIIKGFDKNGDGELNLEECVCQMGLDSCRRARSRYRCLHCSCACFDGSRPPSAPQVHRGVWGHHGRR